jgi:hypothetical protein
VRYGWLKEAGAGMREAASVGPSRYLDERLCWQCRWLSAQCAGKAITIHNGRSANACRIPMLMKQSRRLSPLFRVTWVANRYSRLPPSLGVESTQRLPTRSQVNHYNLLAVRSDFLMILQPSKASLHVVAGPFCKKIHQVS